MADSEKIQGESKGFRGIGRLGGVGYCHELRFVTSYSGENMQTVMVWNAERLNKIIHNPDNHDSAEKVLEEIISYSEEPCDLNSHFFRVEMIGINKENEKLLDVDDVEQYISEVAPVDFDSTFYFTHEIERFIENHDEISPLNIYPIYLREEGGELREIRKKYPNGIYKINNNQRKRVDDITDIQADIIRDENGNAIAWIWYAISAIKGTINQKGNPMRGLRLRQFNILIGDRETLSKSKFFSETRGNHYFLGEVHTLSKKLRPNARRDYFNESQATSDFEKALQEYIKNNLYVLYRNASKMNSAYKKLLEFNKLLLEIKKRKEQGVASNREGKIYAERKSEAIKKAQTAIKDINQVEKQAANHSALAKVVKQINKNAKEDSIDLNTIKNILSQYNDGREEELSSKPQTKPFDPPQERSSTYGKGSGDTPAPTSAPSPKPTPNPAPTPIHQPTPRPTPTPVSTPILRKKSKKKEKGKHLVDELSFLNKRERKLVSAIYGIIQENLILDEANDLIGKIQEDLKNHNVS